MELTTYHRNWPVLHSFLKEREYKFSSEAFGMLMTLKLEPYVASAVCAFLPTELIIDCCSFEDAKEVCIADGWRLF